MSGHEPSRCVGRAASAARGDAGGRASRNWAIFAGLVAASTILGGPYAAWLEAPGSTGTLSAPSGTFEAPVNGLSLRQLPQVHVVGRMAPSAAAKPTDFRKGGGLDASIQPLAHAMGRSSTRLERAFGDMGRILGRTSAANSLRGGLGLVQAPRLVARPGGLLVASLASRIPSRPLLEQRVRGEIYREICREPGIHYRRLLRRIGVSNGTLAFHLAILERSGLVESRRAGGRKLIYPRGVKPQATDALLTPARVGMLRLLRGRPGITLRDLADSLTLEATAANYHLAVLRSAGLVNGVRSGRRLAFYLAPREYDV